MTLKFKEAGTVNLLVPLFSVPCIIYFFIVVLSLASCAAPERYGNSAFAVASWYGAEFHGRPTSSGDMFDMYKFTCAHRVYPFGTKLKVTNISNNKAVECIVNDRGPFVSGRDIDLSYAAAKEINLTATGTVRIERIGREDAYIKRVKYLSDVGPFTIQLGSFKELSNASILKTALGLKYAGAYITEVEINGDRFYRVRIGKFRMKEDAFQIAKILADEGYNVFITHYDEKI